MDNKKILKFATFNCYSVKKNSDYIQMLLKSHDIVLLQETLLHDDELEEYLSKLNENVEYFAIPGTANLNNNLAGRVSGGLAFLWNKKLNAFISPIKFTDRILGLILNINGIKYLMLNVYLPCNYQDHFSLLKYRECIADLENIINLQDVDNLIIAGDFNCKYGDRFFNEISILTNTFNLKFDDIRMLPNDSFTYYGSGTGTTSWLDHICSNQNVCFSNICILYDIKPFDHMPLHFELEIDMNFPKYVFNNSNSDAREYIKWDNLGTADKNSYKNNLSNLLSNVEFNSFNCTNINCKSDSHLKELEFAFDFLVNSMKISSQQFMKRKRKNNFKPIPGWNDFCKDLHSVARSQFLNWKANNCPRQGVLFDAMNESRADFKRALNYCKNNELEIRNENLVKSFGNKNKNLFWKEISRIKSSKAGHVNKIDDCLNPREIVNIFNDKYKIVFDDPNCKKIDAYYKEQIAIHKNSNGELDFFKKHDVKNIINSLKATIGWDNIHSNHLKFGGDTLHCFITKLFNSFLQHGFLPKQILKGEFRPIVKNKLGNKYCSNNYRPIMNSSNLLKVFEYCLLHKFENHIQLNNKQFGFRKNTSTTMAISVIKETIHKYLKEDSNVHTCFLAFSKAFDKINHSVLISKMIKCKIPSFLINIFDEMFNNQYVHVSFNGVNGEDWKLGNGCRQGSVLSPILFSFYINDLLDDICNIDEGCSIGYYKTNVIGYADDISLIAPSSKALQSLLDKLTLDINELCLTLNTDKCKYMVFKAKAYKNVKFKNIISIHGKPLEIVHQHKYLGIILSDDFKISEDIKRNSMSFLKQFYPMYRKFSTVNRNLLGFLFKTFCSSFYGSELWYNDYGSSYEFKNIGISYHKAIKKMLGVSFREHNHPSCNEMQLPLFKHFHFKKMISFYFNLINSPSPCIVPLKGYLKTSSLFTNYVNLKFREVYDIQNILENDIDAIFSRISFIQNNESISEPQNV